MTRREQKKRIKDCLSQMRYVYSVYASEIKKPETEQDTDLIEECLETMSYLHEVAKSLSGQMHVQRRDVGNRIVLRRVATVAIAFAILLIGMSVAEAAGFRVWSAIVHWDSRYLHVTYVSEDQDPLPDKGNQESREMTSESLNEEITCQSISEALDAIDVRLLLPDVLPSGMQETSISYFVSETEPSLTHIMVLWANEDHYIWYYAYISNLTEWSISHAQQQSQGQYRSEYINNIEFLFVDNTVYWIDENASYSMETDLEYEDVLKVLKSITYH